MALNENGLKFKIVHCKKLEIPSVKWNMGTKIAEGNWLVTISDDSAPHPNWLSNALKTPNSGFLGLPDGVTGQRNHQFTPLYMATRDWLRKYNGGVLVIPHYRIWYADIETSLRAQRSLTYRVAWNAVVEQLHTIFNTAPNDEIYKIGEERRVGDLKTFEDRMSRGFPDDFERVL